MKIIVTGGAGFIGSHTCEELLSKGHEVLCIDNFNNYYNPEFKERNVQLFSDNPSFTLLRGDITDKAFLEKIFSNHKPQAVIHLAARAGVRASLENPELYKKVNVLGTKNLLELSSEHGVSPFIFGSSSSVYGKRSGAAFSEKDALPKPMSPYAETKQEAEKLCKEFHEKTKMAITCLRFFTVYGERGRPDMAPYKFASRILKGESIDKYGDGSSQRDYTYVKDIVSGIILSLEKAHPFAIFNLGNGNPVSLNTFIETIEKTLDKKATINQLPDQPGDVPFTFANISHAKELLGYSPQTNLEEGLKAFTSWLKSSL